jgi:Ca-activated chloride channel family protein
MKPRVVLSSLLLAALLFGAYCLIARVRDATGASIASAGRGKATQGSLQVIDPEKGAAVAECPLKRTDVKAEISGFLARVVLTQEFENPFKDKIEAVYTFPLPHNAAVDDMTMLVGERTIRGKIKRREEARAVYEAARDAGQVASLLDQERPNIFTQAVANIMPGEKVKIVISYVDWLQYEDGAYEFVFPMVVGPRYIPGDPIGKQGGGYSPDTTQVPDASRITPRVAQVPDASRITPQVAQQSTRAGHDISVEVALDAGVPIDALTSTGHDVEVDRRTPHSAVIQLKNKLEIPNKDFILKYDVAGRNVEDAVLTHRSGDKGFFTMILQPPERVAAPDVTPKELVFVLDTSGSMSGFPIEKAKECMKLALDGLYPQDTFNLITFSGDTHILFPDPVPATPENLAAAKEFLASRSGQGGTEMMAAIKAALDPSDSKGHVRIVCFMTDGYVGNDLQILSEVQKHPNARIFSFGIGNSVNRFLLSKMAEEGRGEVEFVNLRDDGSAAARRFHERIRNPLLTDVSLDWGGTKVEEVFPRRTLDLFSTKPVIITGQYTGFGRGVIKLKGRSAGREFVKEIPLDLPARQPRNDVLATLWARAKIDDLLSKDYDGAQRGKPNPEVAEAITKLGLEYRLMTQYTSFVAVEEMTVTDGGQPRRVEVPVELPEGVSRRAVGRNELDRLQLRSKLQSPAATYLGNIGGLGQNAVVAQPVLRPQASEQAAVTAGAPDITLRVQEQKPGGPGPEQTLAKGTAAGQSGGAGTGSTSAKGTGGKVVATTNDGGRRSQKTASPEEEKRQVLSAKLHPVLLALVERLKNKNATPGSDEQKFVRKGKAEIQIILANSSAETMATLKGLGFEALLESKTAKIVIGRVPIEKLGALAELEAVRYVSPMN